VPVVAETDQACTWAADISHEDEQRHVAMSGRSAAAGPAGALCVRSPRRAGVDAARVSGNSQMRKIDESLVQVTADRWNAMKASTCRKKFSCPARHHRGADRLQGLRRHGRRPVDRLRVKARP